MDTWTEDGFIGERLCVGMASFSESEEAARRALWDRIRGCLTVRPCVHVSMWGGGGGIGKDRAGGEFVGVPRAYRHRNKQNSCGG